MVNRVPFKKKKKIVNRVQHSSIQLSIHGNKKYGSGWKMTTKEEGKEKNIKINKNKMNSRRPN